MNLNDVQFGQFGDMRDSYSGVDQPYTRQEMFQPPGSKHRFELEESYGNVTARKIGKPDDVLPGGRAAKQPAAGLYVWGGGTGSPEGHKEIMQIDVAKGYRGKGLSEAMLRMALDRHPNLSHSSELSGEGARFAARNPLPGDTEKAKRSVAQSVVGDAAAVMLGGTRRRGYGS